MSRQMHVYLLRHGEAADQAADGSCRDEARELTSRGIERLQKACSTYARIIGKPGRIVHSPLLRARQSAEILAAATGTEKPLTEKDELRPGGRAPRVVDFLQGEFLDGCESVVLVGHEPLFGDLLGLLVSGNDRLSLQMGKGMLAAIRVPAPQVMTGRLVAVLSQAAAVQLA